MNGLERKRDVKMRYFQGFVIPVPDAGKSAYLKVAAETSPIFTEFGAGRTLEGWGAEIPRGETTDLYRAVAAQDDENVVFSWIEWSSEAECDAAHERMMQDERMQEPPEAMPFDGKRMIYAGFDVLGETGPGGTTGWVQGYLAPVLAAKLDAFREMSAIMREIAVESGALRAVDGFSDRIESGSVTDFKRAVAAQDGEGVAFGFVEWASKADYESGSAKMHSHPRMPGPGSEMPLDGRRMCFGGFEVLLDVGSG